MNASRVRWGILGTAEIARKNWKAIHLAGNATLTRVASRALDRSRAFVDACQSEIPFDPPPIPLGSYEELIASPDVDALYLPLPTAPRQAWVLAAARAGKHVVCEKPCAVDASDLREMIETCARHRVQFMDGTMFVHSLRFARMLERIHDGTTVGGPRRIVSQFTFRADDDFAVTNIRANSLLEPQGCVGDLGWYCARFALEVMRGALPVSVRARVRSEIRHPESPASVPAELSAELDFADGVTASFFCSFLVENQQWANVSGPRGNLQVTDFVLPFAGPEMAFDIYQPTYGFRGCDARMEPRHERVVVRESSHGDGSAQEVRMFRAFSEQVLSGSLRPSWPAMSLATQQVLDFSLESARRGGQPVSASDATATTRSGP